MRMWNINPKLLCSQHLRGEHYETHKIAGCIEKNKSIKGYIETGLVEVHNLKIRHDELVLEMKDRDMDHKSPLPDIELYQAGKIDIDENIRELMGRCEYCKGRIVKYDPHHN